MKVVDVPVDPNARQDRLLKILPMSAAYNPRTGTYARGAAAYGPYGGGRQAVAFNPRTGTVAATRQGTNYYEAWGTSAVIRGNEWARTARVANDDARAAGFATSRGGTGFVGIRRQQQPLCRP